MLFRRPIRQSAQAEPLWKTLRINIPRKLFQRCSLARETALDWSDGNAERLQELAGLYQQAMEDYNNGNTQAGTLVETYLEEARALAEAQYDSSEAVRAQTDAENDMITAIRENTAALGGWKAQYDLSQNLTKGRAATWTATTQTTGTSSGTNTMIANGYGYANVVPRNAIGYAVGIDYVPYDNFLRCSTVASRC